MLRNPSLLERSCKLMPSRAKQHLTMFKTFSGHKFIVLGDTLQHYLKLLQKVRSIKSISWGQFNISNHTDLVLTGG